MRTRASRLVWQEVSPSWVMATGAHGTYTRRRRDDGAWRLLGKGHDGLLMMALPMSGALFPSREAAEVHADGLEQRGPEGEMSGA